MRARREHAVPLPTQAVELLKSMLPITGCLRYAFTNRSDPTMPIGTNYANNVMDLCGLTAKQSPPRIPSPILHGDERARA